MTQIYQDKTYCYYGSNDKENDLIFKYTEGGSGINNVGKMENILYYRNTFAKGES